MTTLKFYRLSSEVNLPRLATDGSACFDLQAWLERGSEVKVYEYSDTQPHAVRLLSSSVILRPFARALIPTGLIADIPSGYSLRVHPRSGLALKNGITLTNAEGVIDEDYVEPLFVMLTNMSGNNFTISNGDRIAQAELQLVIPTSIQETSVKPAQKTSRTGGLGSTGVSA
jgi:dUTP pyrophosphatase